MNGQHFDVVVVGAGPAGLAAACEAAKTGARVAVLDDNPRAGGQVWRNGPAHPPSDELAALLHEIQASGNVALASAARIIAPLDKGRLLIESAEQGGACIGYDRLILATGARELLLPFDGWTLKGGVAATIVGGRVLYANRDVAGTEALRPEAR